MARRIFSCGTESTAGDDFEYPAQYEVDVGAGRI